ncbi:hypothetical protein [Desulfogranum japonicum]|uniref:hypothetical protein n=1 Tax=Desulfogranum japonicum TaxID=231447 RepID=UPI00048C8C47|nr:hypothetical protein [Desulfogranum japonicum]
MMPKNISIASILLCLFIIVSFLSFDKIFGDVFVGAPFKVSILTLAFHLLESVLGRKKIFIFNFPNLLAFTVLVISYIFSYYITVDVERSISIFENFSKCIVLYLLIANIITTKKELVLLFITLSFVGTYIAIDYYHHPVWEGAADLP